MQSYATEGHFGLVLYVNLLKFLQILAGRSPWRRKRVEDIQLPRAGRQQGPGAGA